jgi:hypothetical protein
LLNPSPLPPKSRILLPLAVLALPLPHLQQEEEVSEAAWVVSAMGALQLGKQSERHLEAMLKAMVSPQRYHFVIPRSEECSRRWYKSKMEKTSSP